MSNQQVLREATVKLQKIYKQRQVIEKHESLREKYNKKVSTFEFLINSKTQTFSVTKSGLDLALIDKLKTLSKCITDGKVDNSIFTGNQTTESYAQTDSQEIKKLDNRIKSLETENDEFKKNNLDLQQQTEVFKQKTLLLQTEIQELKDQLLHSQNELDSLRKTMEKIRDENFSLNKLVELSKVRIKELEKVSDDYSKAKNIFKDNLIYGAGRKSVARTSFAYDRRSVVTDQYNQPFSNPNNAEISKENALIRFFKQQLMQNIVRYLQVEDIANLKLVNTVFLDSLDKDVILNNDFLMKIIKKKNDRIIQLFAERKEICNFNDVDVYQVNNEYVQGLINT